MLLLTFRRFSKNNRKKTLLTLLIICKEVLYLNMRLQRSNSEKQKVMKKVVYKKVGNKQLRVKEGSIFQVIKETPKTLKLRDEYGKEHTFTNCKEFFTEVK